MLYYASDPGVALLQTHWVFWPGPLEKNTSDPWHRSASC